MSEKRCSSCRQDLPLREFHSRGNGRLHSHCRTCKQRRLSPEARKNKAKPRPGYRAPCLAEPDYQERQRSLARARYYRNREALIAGSKEWQRKHPEKRLEYAINCNARRRAKQRNGIPIGQLRKWREAQPRTCYWCGARNLKQVTIDHYVPLSRGGQHEIGNLVIACKSCNSSKHAKDPLEFARERGRLL